MSANAMGKADERAAELLRLASSAERGDQERLRGELGSLAVLHALNSEDEYDRLRTDQLRLEPIIRALAANPAPAAASTLGALAEDQEFLASESREEMLLRAAAGVRPPPPALLSFLEAQSDPESANLQVAIDVLVENGSEPALDLLERRLADPEMEPDYPVVWMRDSILRHRQDAPLLMTCEHLLESGALSRELEIALLEALFVYRPEEWYPPIPYPQPPDRRAANPEARTILKRIADRALSQQDLPAELRAGIGEALAELDPAPVSEP